MKHIIPTNSLSAPLYALVPFAKTRQLARLSGDPTAPDSISVVSEDAHDVGLFCAALLRGLAPERRREALSVAQSEGLRGVKLPGVPLASLFPNGINVEQAAKIVHGYCLLLLALGEAPASSSVGTVTAKAASMATGTPFASDPAASERQDEVLLAKAILEAHLLGDADAQAWFEKAGLTDALRRMSENAAAGTTDQIQESIDAVTAMQDIYDCMQHDLPLGGSPMAGSAISDFFKDVWGATKRGIADALVSGSSSSEKPASSKSAADGAAEAAEQPADISAADTVQEGLASARKALDDAKAAMSQSQESTAAYREKLRQAAKSAAKLQWAQAILDSPDDVAEVLTATTPNMADMATFLQSFLSILPAAKSTGNLGTLKSLIYALRSAMANGSASGSLAELLTGDVGADEVSRGTAPAWLSRLQMYKDNARSVAGSVDVSAAVISNGSASSGSDYAPSGVSESEILPSALGKEGG